MTIVLNDILRCTIEMSLGDGSIVQNIFHHQRKGIGIISDASHIVNYENWAEAMYAEIAGMIKNDVVMGLASLDLVEFVAGKWTVTGHIGVFTPTFTPTGVGDMLPNQSSAFVTFPTARPKTVGRKFLLPFEEAWQAGSFLVAGAVTDVVAWADDAVNNITIAAPLDYMVPGVPRTGLDQWEPFTLAVVTNLLGSQRRRRPGEGA